MISEVTEGCNSLILLVLVQNILNMNQENETYDNIPIINSFLTTIHENPPSPSRRDPTPRQTLQSCTKQVDEWFQAQSKALQTKKQRQLLKQNRLKQLQDEFQAQRMKKQKELEQKISISEKNKNKTLLDIRQKLHKVSLRHNKVFTKVQDQHQKELQQHFHTRKAYEIEPSRKSSRIINTSQQSSYESRHRSLRDSKTKTLQQEMTQTKMQELTQRLEKAKTMSRQKQEETINKARNHNIIEIYHVQNKARDQHDDYLRLYASRMASKMETADAKKQQMEKKLQKQNEQRHKAYSEKLKRIQTNLRQRQEQQQQKFEELSKKLQKPAANMKSQRQHRETVNHRRFLSNWQQLQRQKISRADQIIQKHNEITLKNRLLKERKQALYRTLKVDSL